MESRVWDAAGQFSPGRRGDDRVPLADQNERRGLYRAQPGPRVALGHAVSKGQSDRATKRLAAHESGRGIGAELFERPPGKALDTVLGQVAVMVERDRLPAWKPARRALHEHTGVPIQARDDQ